MPFRPVEGWAIDGFHYLKPAVYVDRILRFEFGVPFHVRLPETKKNVKILILRRSAQAPEK